MRLVGRGWYQSLSGAYEEPPAMPVGYFFSKIFLARSLDKVDSGVKIRNPLLNERRKSRSCGVKKFFYKALDGGKFFE